VSHLLLGEPTSTIQLACQLANINKNKGMNDWQTEFPGELQGVLCGPPEIAGRDA
jgi:hypothetical protein